jgi:hypothetical protein
MRDRPEDAPIRREGYEGPGGRLVVWLAAGVARAGCGDPGELVAELERAALEGRYADAEAASAALVGAFGCGPRADPTLIARMWLCESVILAARGEAEACDSALAAAARVSPTTWNGLFGPALHERWVAASQAPSGPPGRILVDLPDGYVGVVDGAETPFPAVLPPGLHLIQAGVEPAAATAARVVDLPPGTDLVLDLGLPPASTPAGTPEPATPATPSASPPSASSAPVSVSLPPDAFDAVQVNCDNGYTRRLEADGARLQFDDVPTLGTDGKTVRCRAYFFRGEARGSWRIAGGDDLSCGLSRVPLVSCVAR